MPRRLVFVVCWAVVSTAVASAAELRLTAPLDYQVVQRTSPGQGFVRIAGELSEACPAGAGIEARLLVGDEDPPWQRVGGAVTGTKLTAGLSAPAGGWRRLEVRIVHDRDEWARDSVAHVGIGEVFIVAGQSNAANHGEERQVPKTGRVAAFDGTAWRIANDPQPGASGTAGSFLPPLGDALVERLDVPIGFTACGIGATSVREWLPAGATFPQPPTIERRVRRLADGSWASDGQAYATLVARMKGFGPHGFRAVLWHQGESDANQKDPSRTLPGAAYREYLERLIRQSQLDIGWEVPWIVAQASYHGPGDEGSTEIRAAQAALWREGIAVEGPDSDALAGAFRERGGQGVHFSGPGLREHGQRWAERIVPWIEAGWTAPRTVDEGTEWSRFEQLPLCHSIGWVNAHVRQRDAGGWDGVLDEARWGIPSTQQAVARDWAWRITDEQWRRAVAAHGEGAREEVRFDLWIPADTRVVKGVVVISGHGSGVSLFRRPDLRALARDLDLAIVMFLGNPVQRGFWPRSLLFERLATFGAISGHPELEHAPLFLYGHSNGTGFSAIFAAEEPARVWGWVSMRPGITFQVYQPRAAAVPGLVVFGERDHFLDRPSREENLAVVPTLRSRHDAVWNIAVEPDTGHGPGEKTWPLVFSFLRHTFAARVPAAADPRQGPVTLATLATDRGHLGLNWDPATGGYQSLPTAPYADFPGDRGRASWLVNAAYAADWQAFQRDGAIATPAR
jgi:hypothetical protein